MAMPLHLCIYEEWSTIRHLVLPIPYSAEVLQTAQEIPISDNVDDAKTYKKIFRYFYWPGIKRNVAKYCLTCNPCEVVGKERRNITLAPLYRIPKFEEPFNRVLVD